MVPIPQPRRYHAAAGLTPTQTKYGAIVMSQFHALSMASITGEDVEFASFKDKLCLVVNVASQ
jgi:hypothetical protein